LGLSKSYHGWQVVAQWSEKVGEQIAKRAKAIRFEDGVLYVSVEDASWRQNLAMEIDNILTAIHKYPFGRVVTHVRLTGIERGHE
jgi:predicted nucleic acid-binding Zn ribbon protein